MANWTIAELEKARQKAKREGRMDDLTQIEAEIAKLGRGASRASPMQPSRDPLVQRARESGAMSPFDLYPPEPTKGEKFLADLDYGLEQPAIALRQAWGNLPGRAGSPENREFNDYVTRRSAEYQEGLGQDTTGGRLAASLITESPLAVTRRIPGVSTPARAGAAEGAVSGLFEPVPGVETPGDFWGQKALDVGTAATFGMGFEGAPRAITGAVEGAANAPQRGLDRITGQANPSRMSPEAQIARAVEGEMNLGLTPGQLSQNEALLQAEQLARESMWTRAKVAAGDEARAGKFGEYIDAFVQSQGDALPPAQMGMKLQDWATGQAQEMVDRRAAEAAADYGRALEVGQPIPVQAYRNYLESIVERGAGVVGAGQNDIATAAKNARAQLERLDQQGGIISPQEVLDLVRGGRGSSGSPLGVLDANYGDHLRAQARDAILTDVDMAAPEMGQAINQARANYARNSQILEGFETEVFGKAVGKQLASDLDGYVARSVSPAKVWKNLNNADPYMTEISMERLRKSDPELARQFGASVLAEAAESSRLTSPSGGLDKGQIDPVAFLQRLGLSGGAGRADAVRRLKLIFPDDPETVGLILQASKILGDSRTANRSGTSIRAESMEALQTAGSMVQNALTGAITSLARGGAKLTSGLGALNYVERQMRPGNVNRGPYQFNVGRRVVDAQNRGRARPGGQALESGARGVLEDIVTGDNRE